MVWNANINSHDLTNRYHNLVNFSENAETPFLNWFRYREGFSGKLIKELIKDSGAQKDEIIVDPFEWFRYHASGCCIKRI